MRTFYHPTALVLATLYTVVAPNVSLVLSSGLTSTGNIIVKTLTPSLVEYIENQVDTKQLQGVAVAVVHSNDSIEYGAWGLRTEDGDEMTTDVNSI